jgi:WhiB family redox-sensing transcriptional regulator
MAELSRLPGPVTEHWDWQMRAACAGLGTEPFFHPDGERGPARSAREAAAKAVCARCPVIRECGAHALAVREPYGVWGGMSEDDRDAILGRGRVAASAS